MVYLSYIVENMVKQHRELGPKHQNNVNEWCVCVFVCEKRRWIKQITVCEKERLGGNGCVSRRRIITMMIVIV